MDKKPLRILALLVILITTIISFLFFPNFAKFYSKEILDSLIIFESLFLSINFSNFSFLLLRDGVSPFSILMKSKQNQKDYFNKTKCYALILFLNIAISILLKSGLEHQEFCHITLFKSFTIFKFVALIKTYLFLLFILYTFDFIIYFYIKFFEALEEVSMMQEKYNRRINSELAKEKECDQKAKNLFNSEVITILKEINNKLNNDAPK